jgi:O-antigen ligase/tetratricopeptide (TPR) repeat protein
VIVAVALTFAALAIGGAPRWAACIASSFGLASAVPYLTSRRTSSTISPLLRPIIVALTLTGLQLIGYGETIAELLFPAKLQLVRDNAAAWGDPFPTWALASYDPPATLVELAKLAGYFALGYSCVRLASIRRTRVWLAGIVAGVASLVAVVALVHQAVGADELYGAYRPMLRPPVLGPLLNPNHLASLLAFSVPIALGLAVGSNGSRRGVWLIASGGLAGTTLLTASRGGAIGLVAGLVVAIAILVLQRRAGTDDTDRRTPLSFSLPTAVIAACAVVLLAVLTAGDAARELAATSVDELHQPHNKFQLWVRSTELLAHNQWLGVGRGAFEPAFTSIADTGSVTYTHVENGYLQAAVDWGVPGAVILLISIGIAARAGAKRWRHGPLEAGVLGAFASLIVHEVADFSIEMPPVAMSAIVAGAILFPARLGTATDEAGERARAAPRKLVAIRAGLLALAAIVVVLALSPIGRTAREDAARLAGVDDPAERLSLARDGAHRHPADYVLAGRSAEALFGLGDTRAVKLVTRALALNPRHSGLHHLAGRMLARSQRPAQSAVEFAEAARWARDVGPIVADVLAVFDDPEAIARALPAEPKQMWRIVQALGDEKAGALAYAQRVAESHGRDARVQALVAYTAIAAWRPDVAVPAARLAWEIEPIAKHGTILGRALNQAGDRAGAIAILHEAAEASARAPTGERVEVLFTLSELQAQTGQLEAAKATLERAAEVAMSNRELRIGIHTRLADIEDRLGNRNQAEWERQQARQLSAD